MNKAELDAYRAVCAQNDRLRRECAELRCLNETLRHETGRTGFTVCFVATKPMHWMIVTGPTGLEHKFGGALAMGAYKALVRAGKRKMDREASDE